MAFDGRRQDEQSGMRVKLVQRDAALVPGEHDRGVAGSLRDELLAVAVALLDLADEDELPARRARSLEGGNQVLLALLGNQACHAQDVVSGSQVEAMQRVTCSPR